MNADKSVLYNYKFILMIWDFVIQFFFFKSYWSQEIKNENEKRKKKEKDTLVIIQRGSSE